MHGTRKPHQLSYLVLALGRKKSLSKSEGAKENNFLLPLPAQKEKKKKVLSCFSFQNKISVRERCQVKSLEMNICSLPASLAMVIKAFLIPAQSHRRAHF